MSVQILRANAPITSLQQGRAGPRQFPDPTQINPATTMQSAQPAHVQPGSENHNSLAQASTQDDAAQPAEPGKVACKLCGIKILKSSMPRHEKTCKKNPDAVKIACERCGRLFSCLSTLNSHLSPPRECTGPTNTTPYSSTRGPGPTRVARTNHRARPYSPSSASSGSEPNRSSGGSPSASSSSSTPSIPSVSSARSRVKSRRVVQQPPPIATGGSLQSFINPDISSDTGSHGLIQQPPPVAAGGGGFQSSVNLPTSSDAGSHGPIQQPPPTAIGRIGGDSQSLAYPPINQFAPPTAWIRRPLQLTTAPYNGTSIANPTQINPSYNQSPAPDIFYTSTTAPPNGFMQRGQVTQPTSHYAHALQYTPDNTSLPLRPPNGLPRYSNVPRLPTPVTVPVPQSNDDYPATAPVHFRAGDPVSSYSSLAGAVSEIPAPSAPQVPGLDLPFTTQSFAQPPQTSAFFGARRNSQTNTNGQRPTYSSSQHYLGPRMQATGVLQAVPQPHANATGAQVMTLAARNLHRCHVVW
ncbi:hypothetical protein BD779DRAFT_113471 [Infundibulicybe gibba]|nr:hypothetical protein BD779DRAFT_113471 [Infundibulicybe gibba]